MNNSSRFEQAILKLYTAFHKGDLNPECACQCAVGNICDNSDRWKYLSDDHGSLVLNYVGMVNEAFGKRINGYLPSELLQIEHAFLQGCGYQLPLRYNHFKPDNPMDRELQFNGLIQAIMLMCQLEGIKNITDYTSLFQSEDEHPAPFVEALS